MIRDVSSGAGASYGGWATMMSRRFEQLAGKLERLDGVKRETALQEIGLGNPGMEQRLRDVLDRAGESARPVAGQIPPTSQRRHSLIFEPEATPVMGTTAPPPGRVTAYDGAFTSALKAYGAVARQSQG